MKLAELESGIKLELHGSNKLLWILDIRGQIFENIVFTEETQIISKMGYKYIDIHINESFDSSYYAIYPDMTEMLQYSISESPDYLRSVVAPPERFVGESDTDYEDRSNEYFSDLAQRGTWRTTVANKGVFMVDQLGNLVELLDTADTDPSGLFAGNLIVSMDKLQTVAQDFINFKGMGLEQKRKKLAELGLPHNKTFSYVDDTAIRAWKKLTFAQGALL